MSRRATVLAICMAIVAAACAGDDPTLEAPAPLPTPAGGVSDPAPTEEPSEPGPTATARAPSAEQLPFGPTAEDAVILYVELVLGESIVGECGAATAPPAGSWCYTDEAGRARVGPIDGDPLLELGLIQTSEGWVVGAVAELDGEGAP